MKNLFLSLAFMLIGSFSFASSNCDVKETNLLIKSEEVIKSVDFTTFKTMVENHQIKIVKKVDFIFYDSCVVFGISQEVMAGQQWKL